MPAAGTCRTPPPLRFLGSTSLPLPAWRGRLAALIFKCIGTEASCETICRIASRTLRPTQIILQGQLKNIPILAQVHSDQRISIFPLGQQWSSFYPPTSSCHSAIWKQKTAYPHPDSSYLFYHLIYFITILNTHQQKSLVYQLKTTACARCAFDSLS